VKRTEKKNARAISRPNNFWLVTVTFEESSFLGCQCFNFKFSITTSMLSGLLSRAIFVGGVRKICIGSSALIPN
jgi:hypothetical protein